MNATASRVDVASRRPPSADAVPRLLAGVATNGPLSIDAHLDRYGELPNPRLRRPDFGLIELVEASGLLGRGGAAFPTGTKLRAVAAAGRRPFVVVNGAEGELLSGKDEALLRHVPQLVLDGAAVAAAAVGAREVTLVVGTGPAVSVLDAAVDARSHRRLDRVSFQLAIAPDGFVVGEETALVHWLNGGPAKPTFTPPRPFERGVRGAPTLVQNVETLANLALIARFGSDWFRGLGRKHEPGTALVTLGGAVARPGVYEIPLGLPLSELIAWAGGSTEPLAAFLIGGYFGTWVAADRAITLRLLDSELRSLGATLGARAIFALPTRTCGLVETARVGRYLADESAGQCGPCVHGLDAIASALAELAWGGRDPATSVARIERWLEQIRGRGACRHPDGAVRMIQSGLAVFADERARHARGTCSGDRRPALPLPWSAAARR